MNITTFAWTFSTLFILIILPGLFLYLTVCLVPQGERYIIEYLGRYTRTLKPGFNLIIPILERVSNKVNMREQVMDVQPQTVITKDNAMVKVDGVVFYKIIDESVRPDGAAKATYQISKLDDAIMQLTTTSIRNVMGSMDLDDLLSKREEINSSLIALVNEATDPWGVKVVRIEIKDIHPPTNLVDAMAKQMIAEREKRATISSAEGQKQAEISRAEGQKQSAILKAEGDKQAEILRAEGHKKAAILQAEADQETALLMAKSRDLAAVHDANARRELAEAEAQATSLLSNALANGDIQAINYFIAQKYVEALQHIGSADNQKLILMPIETAGVIGALGGITEITKEIFTTRSERKPN